MQDNEMRPSPQKFSSPQRTSAMKNRSSPSKTSLPFGKPIEIIKSKLPLIRQTINDVLFLQNRVASEIKYTRTILLIDLLFRV